MQRRIDEEDDVIKQKANEVDNVKIEENESEKR
jgi:hypothetical protein